MYLTTASGRAIDIMLHPLPMEFKGLQRLRAEAPLPPKDAYKLFLLTFAQLSDTTLAHLEAVH